MLPQFSISGALGGGATEFPWMFRSGGPFWNLIGGVTQPVFAGGTLLHTKRAADQALRQAAAQYQFAVLAAYQNVADTLHAMLSDADALAADLAAERAARITLDLTRERMQDGYTAVSYTHLLSARSTAVGSPQPTPGASAPTTMIPRRQHPLILCGRSI